METNSKNNHLLAVDLGLRSGMALYGPDGRLKWYRSQHFGGTLELKRASGRMISELNDLDWFISEGDVSLAAIWERHAMRNGVRVQRVSAESWRETLLLERERRGAADAKKSAIELARRIIRWSDAPAPVALRHDAAEAILIGFWGVLTLGWLQKLPAELGMTKPLPLRLAGTVRPQRVAGLR